jgi:hypothetical protein
MERDIELMRALCNYQSDDTDLADMMAIIMPTIPTDLAAVDYWNRVNAIQTLMNIIAEDNDIRPDMTVHALVGIAVVLCKAYARLAVDKIDAAAGASEPL